MASFCGCHSFQLNLKGKKNLAQITELHSKMKRLEIKMMFWKSLAEQTEFETLYHHYLDCGFVCVSQSPYMIVNGISL